MMNVVGREPPELPEELSRSVKSALAKALGKKMGERFGSCAEFVQALEGKLKIARGGVKPRNARAISPAATVVAAAVLAVAGVGVWHWRGGKAGDGEQTAVPALVSPRETVVPEAADPGREVPEDAHAHSRKPEEVDESVRRAQLEAENAAKEKARQDAEREKARLEAEAKAREQAERIAEAKRQAKAREEAEKAKRVAEAAAREEAERAKRIAEAARKKELYRSLAVMEVKIADYEKFRYRDAISRKLDVLKASLKAAQSARDANDIPTASAIVGELARPCDELETLIGEVEAYYAAKDRVEAARNVALSAKADSYAKAPYGQAEANYRRAGEMAAAGDYPGAAAALARLPGQYEAAREEAANSAEAFYDRAQAALKGRDLGVARECFQAAADKKHSLSLINLGLFYLKGTGVAKDEKRALDLFREAALAGNARAQYLLGGCYAKAVGTGYDRERSRIWMAIAEVGGSRAAAEFLRKAQWPVSAGERRAIGEMLRGGETSEPISADMKAVLKSIHDNCAR
jgi:TPR repeat protein